MSLDLVDIHDEELLPLEAQALGMMLAKREAYVEQGRAREAHGLGTGIWILWNTLKGYMPEHEEGTYWGTL
jgi:hypothetical protein